jgi:MFS family permease
MLLLSGFAMIVFGISCNTMVQEQVPDRVRGRVMAVYSLVFAGLMPVGGLEIGFLTDKLRNEMLAVRVNAVLCMVFAVGLLAWSQAERQRRRSAAPRSTDG